MNYIQLNKKAYDTTANEYASRIKISSKHNTMVAKRFIKNLNSQFLKIPHKKLKMLDVGVGSGLDLSIFEKEKYQTFGVDISEKMIDVAKLNTNTTQFYCGNFLDIEFKTKFHGIYAQAFIHLFPKKDVSNVFKKMHEILEPGGLIHFSTTINKISSEGLEEKKDYSAKSKRFRKKWVLDELHLFLQNENIETIDEFETIDPMKKYWINIVIK